MASKDNREDKKLTGEQKLIKKLEGENRALKARSDTIPFSSKTMKIGKNDANVGESYLVVMGKSEKDNSLSLCIHRPVGNITVPEGSWCISRVEDVPKFVSSKDHPGSAKINANISKLKHEYAVAHNILEEKDGLGDYGYPGISGTRNQLLDEAKNRKASYKKATGGDPPNTVCFMDVEAAKLEIQFASILIKDQGMMDACKPLYVEMAKHKPTTLTGTVQVAAPYLYGKGSNEVVAAFFHNVRGMDNPSPAEIEPDDFPIIKVKIPLEIDINYSEAEWALLSNALDNFHKIQKDLNILVQEANSMKKKGTNQQKSDYAATVKAKSNELDMAASIVKAADIPFAKTLFKEPEYTLVSMSDLQ